jgi:hypothetical protein
VFRCVLGSEGCVLVPRFSSTLVATCVGSRVRLVGVFISFEKNFYRLPFTPSSMVHRIGPSIPLFFWHNDLFLRTNSSLFTCMSCTLLWN